MICDYGCGREATHQFPSNGKWCCEKNTMSCPKMKEVNRNSQLKAHKEKPEIRIKQSKSAKQKFIDNPDLTKELKKNAKKRFSDPTERKKQSDRIKKYFSSEENKLKNSIYQKKRFENETEEEKNNRIQKSKITHNTEEFKKQQSNRALKQWREEESRKILLRARRITHIKIIESKLKNGNQIFPNYNPKVCDIIDDLAKKVGYGFQHAQNGGEYFFKDLGYWVDGFNKKYIHIVEGDEPHHFDSNGNLLPKDVGRQEELILYCWKKYSKCTFTRIRV
jgi:hypothetical protein